MAVHAAGAIAMHRKGRRRPNADEIRSARASKLCAASVWRGEAQPFVESEIVRVVTAIDGYVLTLAGTTTVFTAHALYGLIGPGAAFVLLAILAVETLVAAVLHGPAVAACGILASYGIPFLAHADRPAVAATVRSQRPRSESPESAPIRR